jgi:hypothetical protein
MPKEKVQDLQQAIERRLQNAIDQGVYTKGDKRPSAPTGCPGGGEDLCTGGLSPTPGAQGGSTNRLEKIVGLSMAHKWNSELAVGGISDDSGHTTFETVVRRLTSLEERIESLSDHLLKGRK